MAQRPPALTALKSLTSPEEPNMPPAWIALGVLIACMVICVAIYFYIGRRHFYRTNAAGVQEFKSYGRAVRSQLFEFLLTMIALVCFYVGFGAYVLVMGAPRHYW
jgi:uncharacterized membrane protein